ncbi:MAG: hypothetical protein RIS64_1732 [Bacteroidota bacterium]|jgi:hypothetical protein
MINIYRVFEVASGFEPLYEVLQTTAQPLGYATILNRRKDNIVFLNNANLFSKNNQKKVKKFEKNFRFARRRNDE